MRTSSREARDGGYSRFNFRAVAARLKTRPDTNRVVFPQSRTLVLPDVAPRLAWGDEQQIPPASLRSRVGMTKWRGNGHGGAAEGGVSVVDKQLEFPSASS
jgi:hypothetical protein